MSPYAFRNRPLGRESKNINTARSILVQGSGTLFNRRARGIHVVYKEEAFSLCQGGRMHPKGSSDIGAAVFSAQLRLGLGRPGATEQPGINRGIDLQPNPTGQDERLIEATPAQPGQVQGNGNNAIIVFRRPCALLLDKGKMTRREPGEGLAGSHIARILEPEDALPERLGRAA